MIAALFLAIGAITLYGACIMLRDITRAACRALSRPNVKLHNAHRPPPRQQTP